MKTLLLLIEDNPLLTGVYKAAFERAGFDVILAHDGKSGLELAKTKKPAGIVLDLLMPGIDGFGVLQELKTDASTKDVKTVVLTSDTKQEDVEKAKRLGAVDYLVKSELNLADIVARVSGVIAQPAG
jgi:DNA-binding response OmpR family regulator